MPNKKNSSIVMLGTSLATRGGVASVVNVYKEAGLFADWPITYIATHRDGSRFTKLVTVFLAYAKYLPTIVFRKPDILHVHMASRASFWRKLLFIVPAFIRSIPVVIHLHGGEFHIFAEKESGKIVRKLIKWVFQRSSLVILLSPQWQSWVDNFVVGANTRVVYNPVILPDLTAKKKVCGNNLLFLGRLGKQKGFFNLLNALAIFQEKCSDVMLYAGGDGDIETIKLMLMSLDIENNVKLLGWVNGTKKNQLLLNSRIFVLPSYNEGLPMSILEAMSWGLPIIATPVGGIPEAIDDMVEGILVEPGDISALTEAIDLLCNDELLAIKMGAAARARVEKQFSAEVVLPQLEEIYKTLLSK